MRGKVGQRVNTGVKQPVVCPCTVSSLAIVKHFNTFIPKWLMKLKLSLTLRSALSPLPAMWRLHIFFYSRLPLNWMVTALLSSSLKSQLCQRQQLVTSSGALRSDRRQPTNQAAQPRDNEHKHLKPFVWWLIVCDFSHSGPLPKWMLSALPHE